MLNPVLLRIPLDSCCTKTFRPNGIVGRVLNRLTKKTDKSLKRDQVIIPNYQGKSLVIRFLKSIIGNDNQEYKLMYVLQLLLFFIYAEQGKNINFVFMENK
jgi:hypothetical protein